MKFPWVSRELYDGRELMFTTITSRLEKELDYYRGRYEVEKERADRAVDALVQWCGREPISQPSRESSENAKTAHTTMMAQMGEIFGDVSSSILAESEDAQDGTNDDIPEVPPVRSIAERIEELTKIPFYNRPRSEEVTPQDTIV